MTSLHEAAVGADARRPAEPVPVAHPVSPVTRPSLSNRLDWEHRYTGRVIATDAVVVLISTAVAFVAQGFVRAPSLGEAVGTGTSLVTLVITVVLWMLALMAFRTRSVSVWGAGTREFRRVLDATVFTFGILALTLLAFQIEGQKFQIFVAAPIGLLGLLAARRHWRQWLRHQRMYGHFRSRTIVVGRPHDVQYVLDCVRNDPSSSFLVIGAVLHGVDPQRAARDAAAHGLRVAVLGGARDTAAIAAAVSADTIIVAASPDDDPDFIRHLSWELEGTAAELVLSNRLADVAGPRISFRPVEGLPLIHVRIPTFEGRQHVIKRGLDVAVGLVGVAVLALITPVIALAIKLDSRGPVFFHQERAGRDGRPFQMLKFRTMRVLAEEELEVLRARNEAEGPLFKMKDDPRVTRVGRFLRKHSIDEVPQFWNVLRGQMSAVGPRPPLPREVMTYDGVVYRRLYIKPGITGLWQVSGRSDLNWEESVQLDLYYVCNWSIMRDLVIMWRTVHHVLRPHGAY